MAEATLPPPLPFIPPDVQNAAQQAATRQSNTQSTARTSNQTARTTTSVRQPRTSRRASRLGQRTARLVSGALFGFNAPITQRIGRGIAGNRRSEDYQNASTMMEAPPSGEAERVQEAQSQSTLNIISATLQRIEATVNSIAEGSTRRGGAGEAGGGEGGGGILGLLSSIIGGMGAAAGGGIAALGGLIMRTVGRIARAIFSRIPIIGPLILVAMNIEGAMEEYERNGLGAAVTDLLAGIGSDLTFGIIDKDKIKEYINAAMEKIQEWWDTATGKIREVIDNISAAFGRFFSWISDTLSSAFNFFNRRNAELDEEIRRREELLQEAGRERASSENNQPGLGRPRVALPEERESMLQDAFRSRNVQTLEDAERVAGQVAMSSTIAPNTPEYATFIDRARQIVMERSGNASLAAAGAGMDAEMAFTTTPTPAVTVPAPAAAVEQSTNTPTPVPAAQQRSVLQRVGDFFSNRSNNTNQSTTTSAPERAPVNQQTVESNRPRVEGDLNLVRFREVDPEGARDYEQRLSIRTRELVRQRTAQLTPSLDPQRDISQRRTIERQSEVDARADVLSASPELVERINRSGAGNLTVNGQTPPVRAAATVVDTNQPAQEPPAQQADISTQTPTQVPSTPTSQPSPAPAPNTPMVSTPEPAAQAPQSVPDRANTTGIMPQQQNNTRNIDIAQFRAVDPEGAREYEQRLNTRTQELTREFNQRDSDRIQANPATAEAIMRTNEESARQQTQNEVLQDPVIVERINRSGVGNLNTTRGQSTQQVPPTTNIVPAPNAEDRSRALSESAPEPTVIPVPVPQPVPAGGGGGGGGSVNGGGAGPTNASPAQMPPPSHPARPADFITPQVSR